MNIENRIKLEVIKIIKDNIKLADGNEVFFRGILNEEGLVAKVEVLARGNEYSVPAILNRMKKSEIIIHNHPSGHLHPSDNDVKIASIYGNNGGGSYIINNNVDSIYVIVEPSIKKEIKIDIEDYFKENGILKEVFKEYEYREAQKEMALTVQDSLNNKKKTIIEAGTGTGKTLAYLIPAVEWAIKNEKKVVISTNTINLQEQLMQKDIPLIKKAINKEFKEVLVKGRGNYLCIRKLKNINENDSQEMSSNQIKQLEDIIAWAGKTLKGDRNELSFEASYDVWEKVASEGDICLRNKCPFKDKCHYNKAREELIDADLLISNHHMYFADLSIRKESGFITEYSIFPNYDFVVFDEAHNIEKTARDYFSYEISKYVFNKTMNNIYNYKSENSKNGGSILKALIYLAEIDFDRKKLKELNLMLNTEIINIHKDLYEKVNDFFRMIVALFSKEEKREEKTRLKPELLEKNVTWKNEILKRFGDIFSAYSTYIRKISTFQKIISEEELSDEFGIIDDFYRYFERLKSFFDSFDFVMKMHDSSYVYWLEINAKKSNVKLAATPLTIKDELDETLYKNLERIVFTSATLAVGSSFNYFKENIGLNNDVSEKIIKSPFNYKEQMKVLIPSDIEEPSSKNHVESVKNYILDLIRQSEGNAFILFTSYSTLNYFYYSVRDILEEEGYNLLVQGEHPRHTLVDIFKMSKKPILFGTSSFWEGVDVKGKKLRLVVIFKLPFRVPSEPVVEAIIENLKKEGKNPFMDYQIPEAVIKFKQGIGRLIRSEEDTGIITITDIRIIKKHYGRLFMNALPDAKKYIGGKQQLIDNLKFGKSLEKIDEIDR